MTIGQHARCGVGECVAMPVQSYFQPGAFGPEAIGAMSEAYEAALKELQDTSPANAVREAIAGRIIAAARFGERNPVRLREAALREATRKSG
jgi:hypothetical protein